MLPEEPINYCYNQCSGVILKNIFSIVLNKMMSCQFQKNNKNDNYIFMKSSLSCHIFIKYAIHDYLDAISEVSEMTPLNFQLIFEIKKLLPTLGSLVKALVVSSRSFPKHKIF